jgi:putative ABC transport system substrate-binding protein
MIPRRQFITLLGGTAAWPIAARGQPAKVPVIGSLVGVSPAGYADRMAEFRLGLREAGYLEGQNVTIEYRWAEGQFDRLQAMAADLVGRKVAVIFASASALAVRAAMAATKTIPIVFTSGVDPVAAGYVTSLNRPGDNLTGAVNFNTMLTPKRLELLHELVPSATKIAMLVNLNNPIASEGDIQAGKEAASRLGLEIIVLAGGSESEIDNSFAAAAQQRIAAVQVGSDAYLINRRTQIAALALRHAIPTMASARDGVIAGQLMSYGASPLFLARHAGAYVGRILKGEKPSDLPVVQPTRFDLVINLTTAKALGLDVPPKLLALADEVIE